MNKFKVGDTVICNEPSLTSQCLKEGSTYIVSKVNADESSLKVDGKDEWWYTSRFSLCQPEPVPKKAEPKPRIRPRSEVDQERLVEILEAMVWAAKMGIAIPDDWDYEYEDLRESLNEFYEPEITII